MKKKFPHSLCHKIGLEWYIAGVLLTTEKTRRKFHLALGNRELIIVM